MANSLCGANDISAILGASATLMESFREADLALQNALSHLATHAKVPADVVALQHADLLTQTHADLAKLFGALAQALQAEPVETDQLHQLLTLHSLRDALLSPDAHTDDIEHGELSLF